MMQLLKSREMKEYIAARFLLHCAMVCASNCRERDDEYMYCSSQKLQGRQCQIIVVCVCERELPLRPALNFDLGFFLIYEH